MGSLSRASALLAAGLLGAGLTGCGQSTPDTGAPGESFGQEDIVASVRADPELAALVPADIRQGGTLLFGSGIGAAPIAFFAADNKTPMGVDIDLSESVARVLDLRIDRQKVSGDALLTGLLSEKFQVGTANFAVTEERKKVLDFVTYLRDGAAFVANTASPLTEVTDGGQLCGRKIGTGKGTTFERYLTEQQQACVQRGAAAYEVLTYSDAAAQVLAVKEGRVDVLMNAASALRYLAGQQPDLKFLGQSLPHDVGLALKKGSPLAPALAAAVNKLIADGTYARIIAKWRLGDEAAVPRSEINPPEMKQP